MGTIAAHAARAAATLADSGVVCGEQQNRASDLAALHDRPESKLDLPRFAGGQLACAPACQAAGRSHADRPEKIIPILYLPGVSRQELRAVAECPPALMPLAELQYRGAFWSQVNHKDWTVLAWNNGARCRV